jgi:hypothetical protein
MRAAFDDHHSTLEPPANNDGFGILARRDATGVRLYTRNGHDFADRCACCVSRPEASP